MKNAIVFFYTIYINELKKINNNYYFTYNNNNYMIQEFNRNIEEIEEIYNLNNEMLQNGIPVFKILLNKNNSIIFLYNEKNYVLMQFPSIRNRIVTFEDIINFTYIPKNKYTKIDKSMWPVHWERKIDYIEYQLFHIEKKYSLISESINYYIGIWENAISYYNDNVKEDVFYKVVTHKRITNKCDLLSFYNPLNLVIDYKEREVADYIKTYINEKNYTYAKIDYFLSYIPKEYNAVFRMISRLLFPSCYFDAYEEVVYENCDEKNIKKILDNKKDYEKLLWYVFTYYDSIPYVSWLNKKKIN